MRSAIATTRVEAMETARSRLSLLFDVGPVLALAVLMLTTARFGRVDDAIATLVLVVLPLAARRLWPLTVLVVVALGSVVTGASTESPWIQISSVALASLTLGYLAEDRSRSVLAVLGVAIAMTVGFLAQDADPFLSLVLPFVILVPAWIVGDALRGRRRDAAARVEAAERAISEREERLRAAAAEERRHVARELHDVLAHTVSVMLVQAGAARQVVRTAPEQAEEALLAVEATGREAMSELRSLLGVLADEDEGAGLAPQPGIGQLQGLLDRVRQAGLPADLEVQGQPRSVTANLDVTVYRIVQEALTNALRYAGRSRTLVNLTYEPEQIRVEILDDGPATPAPAASGATGRGLAGMRERAAYAGGRLEAGPRMGGGYAVRAWLPLAAEQV
jgi:signal transduction histidine kinase